MTTIDWILLLLLMVPWTALILTVGFFIGYWYFRLSLRQIVEKEPKVKDMINKAVRRAKSEADN